jgi:hypothetical protein
MHSNEELLDLVLEGNRDFNIAAERHDAIAAFWWQIEEHCAWLIQTFSRIQDFAVERKIEAESALKELCEWESEDD